MKSGTALRAVGAGWLRTKVVESGLPAGRDREVLNSGLLLAFSEIEVRDRAQLVPANHLRNGAEVGGTRGVAAGTCHHHLITCEPGVTDAMTFCQ